MGILQRNPDPGFQEEVLQWFHYFGQFSPEMQLAGSSERRAQHTSKLVEWLEDVSKEENAVGEDGAFDYQSELAIHYKDILHEDMKIATDISRIVPIMASALKNLGMPYIFMKTDKNQTNPKWRFLAPPDDKLDTLKKFLEAPLSFSIWDHRD